MRYDFLITDSICTPGFEFRSIGMELRGLWEAGGVHEVQFAPETRSATGQDPDESSRVDSQSGAGSCMSGRPSRSTASVGQRALGRATETKHEHGKQRTAYTPSRKRSRAGEARVKVQM